MRDSSTLAFDGGSAPATPAPPVDRKRPRSEVLAEWLGIAAIAVVLALVTLVLVRVNLLNSAFRRVFALASAAFVVHHFLPARRRQPFFVLLCFAALLLVMGGLPDVFWDAGEAFRRATPIVLVGCGLIAICLLPIGFWRRAALLFAAGGVIAAFRAGALGPGSLALIWPVIAALFMFRLIIFFYDVSASRQRPRPSEALGYFFLLTNPCMTLFPVVDFKTFCRSHYDGDALSIYQRGVRWIVRGVVQLVLYRLVQERVALQPEDVTNGAEVVRFIVASAFLYLNVSGQFHVIVGMLLLFGFNLPETNRRYFLASSFTDYWRRVNIYWKDFVMKVFYYPAFFRMKSRGTTKAMVIATAWSFIATWALHLYQTWWLKGSVGFTLPDALFWSILALLVVANSLWELKRGRQRRLATGRHSVRSAAGLVLRTAGTFACIALLWSLWSTSSVSQWLRLMGHADWHTLAWGVAVLVAIMAATVVYEVLPATRRSGSGAPRQPRTSSYGLAHQLALCAGPLLLLLVAGHPAVQKVIASPSTQPWLDAFSTGDSLYERSVERDGGVDRLVTRDGGYYERLTHVDAANAQLWETLTRRKLYTYDGADPVRPVDDLRFREFIPNVGPMAAYDTTDFRTNRWGMRDRDYELQKPPRTLRIALLGSSQSMGWGVKQDEIFESMVEERLNATPLPGAEGVRYEILNFSIRGLGRMGDVSMLRESVANFHPDVVLIVMHLNDLQWIVRDLGRSLRGNIPIEDPGLTRIVEEAFVTARTPESLGHERLRTYGSALMERCYRRIVEECAKMGALPAAMFLPIPDDVPMQGERLARAIQQTEVARESGLALLDLTHLYDGLGREDVQLPEKLHHMNQRAHAMTADALYQFLTSNRRIDLVARARGIAVAKEAATAAADRSSPHSSN